MVDVSPKARAMPPTVVSGTSIVYHTFSKKGRGKIALLHKIKIAIGYVLSEIYIADSNSIGRYL